MPHPYEIIALVEGTAAWREWRQGGIGSSDAATILGENRFKSAERLLVEKQQPAAEVGRDFAQRRGAALEPAARARYAAAVGFAVTPVCVQSLVRPWQRASLDGLSADGERVVEIKCGPATYRWVAARRRPARLHVCQLQHILAVTGLPVADYWCYAPSEPPLRLQVQRDEVLIARLLAAEEVFWRRCVGPRRDAVGCG